MLTENEGKYIMESVNNVIKPKKIYKYKCPCGKGWDNGGRTRHYNSAFHQIYIMKVYNY